MVHTSTIFWLREKMGEAFLVHEANRSQQPARARFFSVSRRTNTGRVCQLPGNKDFALDHRRLRRQSFPGRHNYGVFCRGDLIRIEGQDGLTAVITDSNERSQLIFMDFSKRKGDET